MMVRSHVPMKITERIVDTITIIDLSGRLTIDEGLSS
jgi:hypothetical protein